jgi:hypothetical protein
MKRTIITLSVGIALGAGAVHVSLPTETAGQRLLRECTSLTTEEAKLYGWKHTPEDVAKCFSAKLRAGQ